MKNTVRILLSLSLAMPISAVGAEDISRAMVDAHNKAREKVGVGPVIWSGDLAARATAWANTLADEKGCKLMHSGPGENLYWASAVHWSDGRTDVQKKSPADVVTSWESENTDYDYASNRCSPGKVCGHYTQVVWANSTKIGCGYRICDNKAQVWVCQYDPVGNYVDRKPY
uniref:Pathogenesis-related protein 1 n=1 Tax=Candidatus Kentrum sp. FW TaxID=2126338 RepID=A0A450S4S0_9GAMM|nr:MAG: pathogenesis-related protein 1 [Candidatus Kentron sp. FW]